MSKKKIVFCAAIVIITLLYAFLNLDVFLVGDKIDYIKIIYPVVLAALICAAVCVDGKIFGEKTRSILGGIIFMAAPLFIMAAVMNNIQIKLIKLWIMNYFMYLSLLMVLLAIFRRSSVSVIAAAVLSFLIFTLNTEVTLFRGAPIVPADIFAVNTAISVAEGYKPVLTYEVFVSFQAALLLCILSAKLSFRLKGKAAAAAAVTAVFVVFITFFGCGKFFETHNPDKYYFDKYDTTLSNKKFGTVLTFWLNAKRMIIEKPEGYSKTNAEEILSTFNTESGGKKPNVVVIMDEAFSDLTGVYDIETDREVLPFFNSLTENTVRGDMLVSVFGGNTCITEFEFLTGLTAGNFDTDTNAFTQSVTKPVNSLAYDFKAMDYKTVAIHPFWGNSWRRNKVYPLLGFDESIFAENFGTGIEKSGANLRSKPVFGDFEYIRGYLSDNDCSNKIKQQFEQKQNGEKLFVFNVTIQNHGGYAYKGKDFSNEFSSSENNSELEQYLTLVNKSDAAIQELVEYFKSYDEPVVLVVFGDHQPNIKFARNTREEYSYLDKNAKYTVPFAIWANYDIEEKEVKLTSPAYLSLLMKESCGIDLTRWDSMRSELRNKYPALTLRSGYNADLQETDMSSEESEIYRKYRILQYGILFDGIKP